MATFIADVPHEAIAHIETELTRRRVSYNPDRFGSGAGYSQAFGIIKRWSYRPWVSRHCWLRPELWKMLQHFASNHVHIPWDAVQVNCNYESKPHRDKGNHGESYIISFGEYTGGELVIDVSGEEKVIDTRLRGHHFNGSQLTHWNKPITSGTKFSLVFFNIEFPRFWTRDKGIPVTKVIAKDGKLWLHIEDCDGAIYEANSKNWVTIREPQVRLERVGKVNGFGGKAIAVYT